MNIIADVTAGRLIFPDTVFVISNRIRTLRDGTREASEVVRSIPDNLPYEGLLFFAVIIFDLGLIMGCHTGPSFREDSEYREIERKADRNSIDLAVTSADIAAGIERMDDQTARVQSELDDLEAAIDGSVLEGSAKETLLNHVAMAQKETMALRYEVTVLQKDAGHLNDQLAGQREISAALSAEHDRREAAGAAVKAELEGTKEELAKVKGQRNLYLAILIAVCLGILGYTAFRVLRFFRIIPV
jgi:hypothetical protein